MIQFWFRNFLMMVTGSGWRGARLLIICNRGAAAALTCHQPGPGSSADLCNHIITRPLY